MSYRRNTRAYSCRRIPRIGYAGRRDGETTRPAQAARRRGLLLLGRDMRFRTRSRPTTWYSIIAATTGGLKWLTATVEFSTRPPDVPAQ